MTTTYNKLVRDRIPEIILKSGKKCSTEILPEEKYLELIDVKLDEELEETSLTLNGSQIVAYSIKAIENRL